MSGSPRHTYQYDVDLGSDTAPARVIRMTGRHKKVLEIGAGPGSITRHLSGANDCDVVALEIDPTAIERLQPFCRKIYASDLNQRDWPQGLAAEGKFDVVIAADVLEHLYDPLTTLRGMKSLLNENGAIILSLPHAGHCVINACLMDEDFEYREWGLLDKTHIRFFGLKNIQSLYANAGLAITDAQFVVRAPEETEFADRWRKLPARIRDALSSNPYGHIYQVVTKAEPVETARNAITLLDVPVETRPVNAIEQRAINPLKLAAVSAARRCLSPNARVRVKSFAQSMGIRL
jgi:2-polyprenyl-3-methyl-5-hydroxy-6-metoxy-1,4-benzoquinol methylase